jgi:hypothetical protein
MRYAYGGRPVASESLAERLLPVLKVYGSAVRGFRADGRAAAAAAEIISPPLARDRARTGLVAAVGITVRSLLMGMDRVVSRKAFMGRLVLV